MRISDVRPIKPEDLLLFKTIADVQLSPDGSRVAYTLTEVDAEKDDYKTNIFVVPSQGGESAQLTKGSRKDAAPRWSPDGTKLAFLSDRNGETPQLYIMPAGGGEVRNLTSLENGAGPAVWSPDGRQILFTTRVLSETPPADRELRARWKYRPRVVTKAHFKADGRGYILDGRSHLFLVSLESGEVKQITFGDSDDLTPTWSPDGKWIAFCHTRNGVADYCLSDIWIMDVDSGNIRRVTENVGRAISPTWSPDGTMIACYGTDEQEPGLGETMVRVWLIPLERGRPRKLTGSYDLGVVYLPPPAITPGPVWSADGRTVTFRVADAGNIHLVRVEVSDGSVWPVIVGERQVVNVSAVASTGKIAFSASDPYNPGDIYICAWDGSQERHLTQVNESLLARLDLPDIERRSFRSPNGGKIDGWLMKPHTQSRPAPLLLSIHGGPHGFAGNAFSLGHFYRYILASRGWVVLTLNPSGSGSYGKAFAHRVRGAWGECDMPEHIAAVDTLVAEGIAAGDKLAVAGYSYGGYMAAWMISHTERFKAAVLGAPITNLVSFHSTSDIGMWFSSWYMNGNILSHRERFRRLSPVNYVDRVTTPTLILHGEADERCPIGQAEEFFIGLVAVAEAPVEFVRYPGSSHLFLSNGRPSHRVDFCRRVVNWVERRTIRDIPTMPEEYAVEV